MGMAYATPRFVLFVLELNVNSPRSFIICSTQPDDSVALGCLRREGSAHVREEYNHVRVVLLSFHVVREGDEAGTTTTFEPDLLPVAFLVLVIMAIH